MKNNQYGQKCPLNFVMKKKKLKIPKFDLSKAIKTVEISMKLEK